MKRYFYYIRDKHNINNPISKKNNRPNNGRPIITVCVLCEGDSIARGVSICSKDDNVEKQEGRDWAQIRALNALVNRSDSEFCNIGNKLSNFPQVIKSEIEDITLWLSTYNPDLTMAEIRMLDDRKKKE